MNIELTKRVQHLMTRGVVAPDDARALLDESGLPAAEFMLALIPVASGFARPVLSGFQVGAVGCGESGALYLGANFEFPACALDQTVHAEQSVVINAAAYGETRLRTLAVSAAPCGHCRQLLSELVRADELQVLLPDRAPAPLKALLPDAFGPADLGVATRLLMPQQHRLEWAGSPQAVSAAARAAFDAAAVSYVPYSNSPAGVGLTLRDGQTLAGSCLENAAFNPGVLPLQAAMVIMAFAGQSLEDVVEATLVQLAESKINYAAAAQSVLQQCAPGLSLQVLTARHA